MNGNIQNRLPNKPFNPIGAKTRLRVNGTLASKMTEEDEEEILAQIHAANAKRRGYADFFSWPINRDLEEWGVCSQWSESLAASGELFFSGLKARGRPNDPPDLEALHQSGGRLAIEVTELVDGDAIRAFRAGRTYHWAEWSKEKFLSSLEERVLVKDRRFPELKEPPYDGGYVVLVHTDEPELSRTAVQGYVLNHRFKKPQYVARAFLLLSYDPTVSHYPYFELAFNG